MAHPLVRVGVFRGKFVAPLAVRFSAIDHTVHRVLESPFLDGVAHILGVGSEEQMRRVHTGRVIAAVADTQRRIKITVS